jgi:hypothetical protein
MKTYDPFNWYWMVGGDANRVYSSAAADYVSVTAPAYVAWASDGTLPTQIATEANLGDVLASYLLRPVASVVLDGYTDRAARAIVTSTMFKIIFQHENRLRAIERALSLNGSPPNLTAAQALAAVKSLM